jgi:hypothetical protein
MQGGFWKTRAGLRADRELVKGSILYFKAR